MTHKFDADFWDQMYRKKHLIRHGDGRALDPPHGHGHAQSEPNAFLAQEAAGLTPGTALDVGCGEGADARWLAQRGWEVTALDISKVALDYARAQDVRRQVTWLLGDLSALPPTSAFDLITANYLHIPPAQRPDFFRRLALALRPNGTLLFAAHHASDLDTTIGRPPIPDLYFTAEEVAGYLAPGRWKILVSGTQPAHGHDREGRDVSIRDMVLKARRIE